MLNTKQIIELKNITFERNQTSTRMQTITLNNGNQIPSVGFGTWMLSDNDAARIIRCAIENGYRHIDTAAAYNNEKGIGQGIRECGISRDQLFVTSKVWNTNRGYDATMRSFNKTLSYLGLDYLDLFLIHWPAAPHQFSNWESINRETWRALEKLSEEGVVRNIGVSNFGRQHLQPLLDGAKIIPAVNQIEYHPGFMQTDTIDFCRQQGLVVEAWSPMGRGRVLNHPKLTTIASHYGRSVAQICIRWALQHGIVPLPKSATPQHIKENLQVFDFVITEKDMSNIDQMELCGFSGLDPDKIDF